MEYATIQREIHIEARPEIVYDVISTPEHLRGWWPDEADYEPVPGGTGTIAFSDGDDPRAHVEQVTVVDADPPRRFSFRWVYDQGVTAAPGNSLLVEFDLVPTEGGTTLRMTESGFRERGWEVAVLEEAYRQHVQGWDRFIPRIAPYVDGLVAAS